MYPASQIAPAVKQVSSSHTTLEHPDSEGHSLGQNVFRMRFRFIRALLLQQTTTEYEFDIYSVLVPQNSDEELTHTCLITPAMQDMNRAISRSKLQKVDRREPVYSYTTFNSGLQIHMQGDCNPDMKVLAVHKGTPYPDLGSPFSSIDCGLNTST